MTTFLLAFAFLVIIVAAMSVGVLFGRARVKGSCGGINNVPGAERQCGCDNPCDIKKKADEAREQRERETHFPA